MPVVTNVSGAVVVRSAGGTSRDVLNSRIVHAGDTLVTGVNSLAVLSLADVGTIRLGPGSTARALATASSLSLGLDAGSMCAQAQTRAITIHAGSLAIAAGDDTAIFSLIRDANDTTFAVYQGQVSATLGNKSKTILNAGEAAVSSRDGNPVKVPIQSVQAQFSALKCPDDVIIARAVPTPEPSTASSGHGGGGGGFLGILLGIGALAALAGHGGGGGGGGGGTPPPTSPPPPGQLLVSPTSLSFPIEGAPQTFSASEANYTGTINAASGDTGVASVAPSSGTNPVIFTVTAGHVGSTTITVTDNHGGSQIVNVTVSPAGVLTVNKSSLLLSVGGASQGFTATEASYGGLIRAVSSDGTVATVMPASGPGPGPVVFNVTPTGAGTTTITVSDDLGHSQNVNVTVVGPLSAAPSSLTFVGTGGTKNFTATDPFYTGIITATSDHPGVATVAPVGSGNGPSATFKVTPVAQGGATITVSDTLGSTTTVSVSVSTGSLSVNPPTLTFTVGGAAKPFTASEAAYTGPINAASSDNSRATVAPSSGSGPMATFNVTPTATSGVDTTIGVSDNHGGFVFLNVVITGPLTPNPSSLTFNGTTAPQMITVSDPNYHGNINAFSTDSSVATVNSSSSNGSFSVTPINHGTTIINFSDLNGGSTSATVNVFQAPSVSPGSLSFTNSNSQTVTVNEPGYSGPFGLANDTCTGSGVASLSGLGSGPSSSVTVTPIGVGPPCQFAVQDTTHSLTSSLVTVSVGPFGAVMSNPTSLTLTVGGASGSLTVTESGYSGNFTAAGCGGIATIGGSPGTSFTVTPTMAGNCAITIGDLLHSPSTKVNVFVTSGSLTVTPTTMQFSGPLDTPQSTTALNYSGSSTTLSAASNDITIATVLPASCSVPCVSGFTVTPTGNGATTIKITDGLGAEADISVGVGQPPLDRHRHPIPNPIVRPTPVPPIAVRPVWVRPIAGPSGGLPQVRGTLTISAARLFLAVDQPPRAITVSEPGYGGIFMASVDNPRVAQVLQLGASGPLHTFTISALSTGTTAIHFSDANGQTQLLIVTVVQHPAPRGPANGKIPL